MAIGWGSLLYQAQVLFSAQTSGDPLTTSVVALQMLFVAVSMLAGAYLILNTSRGPIGDLWKWSKPTWTRRLAGALIVLGSVALLAWLWIPQVSFAGRTVPTGVERFEITQRSHVQGQVAYAQTPPVGGNHAPIWQNCGFYSIPIPNETAVHSLEHGAVWMTYRPDLPKEQVNRLRDWAQRERYVIVSPYSDLSSPVVASAWGYQLRLDSSQDTRLEQFVDSFRLGPQAPEREGPCTGGVGLPE
jgi:hypothetical protein